MSWGKAGAGGIVALAGSWLLGLFGAINAEPPPALPLGKPIEAGQWIVTPIAASVGIVMPDGRLTPRGRRAITIHAEFTNRTSETSSGYGGVLVLRNPPSKADKIPAVYLDRDRAPAEQLHPGLPEKISIVWTFPSGQPVKEPLVIEVVGRAFKPRDNLYAAPGWFNPRTIGTVTIPANQGGLFAPGRRIP